MMYESLGFAVFVFCATVFVVSVALLICAGSVKTIRPVAIRLAVVFGVFAVAGGYVWTYAGPEADLKTEVNEMPTLPLPAPTYMWV